MNSISQCKKVSQIKRYIYILLHFFLVRVCVKMSHTTVSISQSGMLHERVTHYYRISVIIISVTEIMKDLFKQFPNWIHFSVGEVYQMNHLWFDV